MDPVTESGSWNDPVVARIAAQVTAIDDPPGNAFRHGGVVVTAGLDPAPDRLEPFGRKIG
jgi:hypothetical protein